MSFADLLPVRLGLFDRRVPRTRHRAIDEVDRQLALRAGADLLIKALHLQLDDQAREHADTVARIDARHAETVRGLEQQIADLQRRLDVGVKAEHVIAATQEIDVRSLRDRFTDGPVRSLHHSPQAGT
jgi:hypothetical protein